MNRIENIWKNIRVLLILTKIKDGITITELSLATNLYREDIGNICKQLSNELNIIKIERLGKMPKSTKYYLTKYIWADLFIEYYRYSISYPNYKKKYPELKSIFSKLPNKNEKTIKNLKKWKNELNNLIKEWIFFKKEFGWRKVNKKNKIIPLTLDSIFNELIIMSYLIRNSNNKNTEKIAPLLKILNTIFIDIIENKYSGYDDSELFEFLESYD
ncbi:MAG: hypothetical protein PHP82_03815 [Candidatus ainarchaeum sp.]|nr:hypothetical protein [Candidatus ainarchaeum sp.]